MNLFVLSHRRSGTHLTIDSILNNFNQFNCNNGQYFTLSLDKNPNQQIQKLFDLQNCIIKSHILPNIKIYNPSSDYIQSLRQLLMQSPKIYVIRNGLDVMVSLYFYMKEFDQHVKKLSFSQFLRAPISLEPINNITPPQLWATHIETWLASDILKQNTLILKYEQWILNYDQTLKTIAQFLNLPLSHNKIIDVRISNKANNKLAFYMGELKKKLKRLSGKKITAVLPRKGTINDYKNHFSLQDLIYFNKIAGKTIKKLGYDIPELNQNL
jgi:hypothetical protein